MLNIFLKMQRYFKASVYYLYNPFKLYFFQIAWRLNNKHNYTSARNIFDKSKIQVGRYSYGALAVYTYGSRNEGLIIGDFVSIGPDVKFVLGGNHRYDIFLTYPFKAKIFGEKGEALSKGKIEISDDVWIGMNAIILSGVKVGQGAIIAAGSIVTRSVPPYSIVAGNPAKIIKMRFSQDVINELLGINLSALRIEDVRKNKDVFYSPLLEVLDQIKVFFR
jgi:acetyltransferase-like isoleucine patch superfamily enzyme